MFKRSKRSSPRRASNRFLTRRQANRTFKHAVREKVININVKCQTICTSPDIVCPNGGKHILVANQEVFNNTTASQHGFDDALRITRLEGVLWMKPDVSNVYSQASSCDEGLALLDLPIIFRMGLLKSRVQQALGGVPIAVNPLGDGVDPFHLADAVDSRFLKTWDHLWQATREVACYRTTQLIGGWKSPGYVVPALDGVSPGATHQDGYTVPADVCDVCEGEVSGTNDGSSLRLPGWHPFRISYRRPIVLKENDDLNLWFGWEMMRPCNPEVPRGLQPSMQTVGHVYMTVEH